MTEPLVSCRPATNLPIFTEVLTNIVVVVDPNDNLPVVGVSLNTNRHQLRPNMASQPCPGNKDGVVVVLERSTNVKQVFPPNYLRPDLTEFKVVPTDRTKEVRVFFRVKYQEDLVVTGKEKPRRAAIKTWFTLNGTGVQPQSTPATE
jgi:hypothetical protein